MRPKSPTIDTTNVCFFPYSRWAAKVRRVAEVLDRKVTERARETYWTDTLTTIRYMLLRRGADEAEIATQQHKFSQAVWAERARRAS